MKRHMTYMHDDLPADSYAIREVNPDVWWTNYNREYRRLFYAAYGVGGVCPTRPRLLAVPLTERKDGAAQARIDFTAHAVVRACENAEIDLDVDALEDADCDPQVACDYYSIREVDPRAWYAAYCAEYQRLWYTVHGADTCCPIIAKHLRIARTQSRDGAAQARSDFEAHCKSSADFEARCKSFAA